MNAQSSPPQKTDTFDIQTGMAVYSADGQTIGTVMEIAGFGSTKVKGGEDESAELVIQAKTGSGYFNMGSRDVKGIGPAAPLCVPFHGIKEVVTGHGVILNDSIIEELRHQRDPRSAKLMTPPTIRRRWWPKWL